MIRNRIIGGEGILFIVGVDDTSTLEYEGRDITPFTIVEWELFVPADYDDKGEYNDE